CAGCGFAGIVGSALRRGGFGLGRAGLMPGLAAVIGTLNDLSEPPAGLRAIDPIWIDGRSLHVINLPPGKQRRLADRPLFALAVGSDDERAFFRADKNSNAAHCKSPSKSSSIKPEFPLFAIWRNIGV